MNQGEFLSPNQLAGRWGNAISAATLANWRAQGKGPAFVKVGARVRYRLQDVLEYERQNLHRPDAKPEPGADNDNTTNAASAA